MKKTILFGTAAIGLFLIWMSFGLAPAWQGKLARGENWEWFYRKMTNTGYYNHSSPVFSRSPELRTILQESKQIQIYKLSQSNMDFGKATALSNRFAGYVVSDTFIVNDKLRRKELVSVLEDGLNKTRSGRYPLGFEAQYGIYATSHGKPMRLVIDFKHLRVRAMRDYGTRGVPVYGFAESLFATSFEEHLQKILAANDG